MRPALINSNVRLFGFYYSCHTHLHLQWHSHLLIVVLPRLEIIAQGDPVAQLLAQRVQEFVSVPAAKRARESEQLLASAQGVWSTVRELRGGWGAFQADIGVRVHAALVADLIHWSGERFLPGQGQAWFTVTCNKISLLMVHVDFHSSMLPVFPSLIPLYTDWL